jgi:hypothetical protein
MTNHRRQTIHHQTPQNHLDHYRFLLAKKILLNLPTMAKYYDYRFYTLYKRGRL